MKLIYLICFIAVAFLLYGKQAPSPQGLPIFSPATVDEWPTRRSPDHVNSALRHTKPNNPSPGATANLPGDPQQPSTLRVAHGARFGTGAKGAKPCPG